MMFFIDDDIDVTHRLINWGNTMIAEITKNKNKYFVLPLTPNFTSAEAWFDTEIEALEYVLELIKVNNE